ncbi:ribosomal protein L11 methyltransferase [Balneicella halophila]|uniref:Ribosomal protein L11 methyltransferase n=1 Tax=Balneicella halophila TaxID=1537566 RepID=A0A7L4UNW6_BALHA|nr:50S ribosomal protein L11 methyltransferase [Balneicella halophila]PVX49987.1 ribosomal protein L11 methyltransferase [Balneicella halophila]
MEYIVVSFTNHKIKKETNEILIAYLNEMGYEGFEEHLSGVDAYITASDFNKEALDELKQSVPTLSFDYKWRKLEDKNWNQLWEENYKPVIIADKLLVRSTFHESIPNIPYEIIINPQMSFGTGHHETTSLMLEALLKMDLTAKKVLDVGYGTGILSLFVAKQGANVVGVDIDSNAYENAFENQKLNKVEGRFSILKGTIDNVDEKPFDIILANINRNVLLQDMHKYASRLHDDGVLLLSGFLEQDVPKLEEAIEKSALTNCEKTVLNEWVLLSVRK